MLNRCFILKQHTFQLIKFSKTIWVKCFETDTLRAISHTFSTWALCKNSCLLHTSVRRSFHYHTDKLLIPLQWRHNDNNGVSNHQPHGYLLNRLFRRRSKKTSKLRVTGLCVGNSPGPMNSPHKGSVTRKTFSFDDVIMRWFSIAK